jgi:hypothetical protein
MTEGNDTSTARLRFTQSDMIESILELKYPLLLLMLSSGIMTYNFANPFSWGTDGRLRYSEFNQIVISIDFYGGSVL